MITHPPQQQQQTISFNPNKNSIKTRFTIRFLQALKQIQHKNESDPIHQRSNRVKSAANMSMAATVGSKRAWSRAMLWKRIRNHRVKTNISSRTRHAVPRPVTKRIKKKNTFLGLNSRYKMDMEYCRSIGEAKELRKLIPGGESMEDIGSLLEETAHYIHCLTTQVQVMKNILHFSTSPPTYM